MGDNDVGNGGGFVTPPISNVVVVNGRNEESNADVIEVPKVGMVFEKMEYIEELYWKYAKNMGYGVIRVGCNFNKETSVRRRQYWHCEFGPANKKYDPAVPIVKGRRRVKSKKVGCKAHVTGMLNADGLWEIISVELSHINHEIVADKARFCPKWRNIPKHVLSRVKDMMEGGCSQAECYRTIANQLNGFENVPFLLQDVHNELVKQKLKIMERGDSVAMFEYFNKMQEANPEFFYAWTVDKDDLMKDVVWVDARSRAAYEDFNDVVCFDATYITNKYELPFANFVGVNQHGQTILLGCALVRNEDAVSYTWMMKQWLECMKGVQPGGIITDQSAPIRNAIEVVFPSSKHRLCVWHILSKVPKKFVWFPRLKEFHKALKVVVYDSLNIVEFEKRWCDMVVEFGLEANDWLLALYLERSRWVPAFVKDSFWAGMSTTQRIESIHHFFKGFICSKTSLREFVSKYTRAMDHRVNAEIVASSVDDRKIARLQTNFMVEKFFQRIYTDAKFKEIQQECVSLMYVFPKGVEAVIGPDLYEYTISDSGVILGDPKRIVVKDFKVLYDKQKEDIRCECRLFESSGILCRHCIRVMSMVKLESVPEKYVLRRWRRDVERKHLAIKVSFSDPTKTEEDIRYGRIQFEFEDLMRVASESESLMQFAIDKGKKLLVELKMKKRRNVSVDGNVGAEDNNCTVNLNGGVGGGDGGGARVEDVGDPPVQTRTGRPRKNSKHSPGSVKKRTRKSNNTGKESTAEPKSKRGKKAIRMPGLEEEAVVVQNPYDSVNNEDHQNPEVDENHQDHQNPQHENPHNSAESSYTSYRGGFMDQLKLVMDNLNTGISQDNCPRRQLFWTGDTEANTDQ